MDHIRKAIERAKGPLADAYIPEGFEPADVRFRGNAQSTPAIAHEAKLNPAYLETKRIIAHDVADPRARAFDMLRTQVLQSMDVKSWQFLGVTSPTEDCGKSVISTNLALSIARQAERAVLLVDLDLRRPQIASNLGLTIDRGILSVLQGRSRLQDCVVRALIQNQQLVVLPAEAATLTSSELIASRAMRGLVQEIKAEFHSWTVIVDLPPLLSSDDTIAILPQLDCVLFVVGAGTTTTEEIKESNRHLESAEVVRVVLNKAEDADPAYESYSKYAPKPPSSQRGRSRPRKNTRLSRLLHRLSQI